MYANTNSNWVEYLSGDYPTYEVVDNLEFRYSFQNAFYIEYA